MGDALFELEQVLRSKKGAIDTSRSKCIDGLEGSVYQRLYCWFQWWFNRNMVRRVVHKMHKESTQRLRNLFRINLTLGVGAAFGFWRLGRSVQSSVQHILSLEGSRIQRELANIMLKRHHRDPWVMQHLSKHFYSEEVYNDLPGDRPMFRWRYRNFSGETVEHSESRSHREETHSNENNVSKTAVEQKQVYANAATADATENPFDLIFGISESVSENVTKPVELDALSRKQRRKEKRSRRRHRRHHHEEESEI